MNDAELQESKRQKGVADAPKPKASSKTGRKKRKADEG